MLCEARIQRLLRRSNLESFKMKNLAVVIMIAVSTLAFTQQQTHAASCVNGVYRAGCAGPNGAAVVRKPAASKSSSVSCAKGVYRAGCVGPNGAAVVRRPY